MRGGAAWGISLLVLLLVASGSEAVCSQPARDGAEAPLLADSAPAVTLRAASGKTIGFATQNGQATYGASPQSLELPHLVLHRDGALTPPDERTLVVTVSNLVPPPSGLTVTLTIQTYHGDPDLGDALDNRITVWRESQWLPPAPAPDPTAGTLVFAHEFSAQATSGAERLATPTDYYRIDLAVAGERPLPSGPLYTFSQDPAFLLENQWAVPLHPELAAQAGAQPEELVVYYCDMFAFQHDSNDPACRLRREEIPHYVQRELLPAMVEAFRVQTQDWGFPWQRAWTSYRAADGQERLSVALSDGETWFHGQAPVRGLSGISLRTYGGVHRDYETLTDGLLSAFHHELFHNVQRGMAQQLGGHGDVDGQKGTWAFFSEGTAALAESVAEGDTHFAQTSRPRSYISLANGFIGEPSFPGEMNKSYAEMIPYYAAVYWRFLYEQCGGMQNGIEDPTAGMRVIRRSLELVYSKALVDMNQSHDLVRHLPGVMDQVLESPEAQLCPFHTFRGSFAGFSRAIYQLRLDGGRCMAPGIPAGCGFYDPHDLYQDPPVSTLTYRGERLVFAAADQPYPPGIGSSFGIDYVDIELDPSTQGQSVTIEFFGAPGAGAELSVEIWKLMDAGMFDGSQGRPFPVASPERLEGKAAGDRLLYEIPHIDTGETNRLGLIITRLDASEDADPVGAYTIIVQPNHGP